MTPGIETQSRAVALRVIRRRPRLALLAALREHQHVGSDTVTANRHHAVCPCCGLVADVDFAVGHAPCLTAIDEHGRTVDEAEVVYWGICADCATERISQ